MKILNNGRLNNLDYIRQEVGVRIEEERQRFASPPAQDETITAVSGDYPQLKNAVLLLADQCDYATSNDKVGFNKFDAKFGHELAKRIRNGEDISLEEAKKACKKFKKYAKQLFKLEIDFEDIEAEVKNVSDKQEDIRYVIINLLKDKFCFDHASNRWYEWNEHFWKQDSLNSVLACINEVLKKKLHEMKDDLELAAAGRESLGITGEEWDRDPWLLGCLNGVIELKTGRFRPGKQEDYLLSIAPTKWEGIEEPAPTWDRFLREIFNNDLKLIAYIQRLFGYAIAGVTDEDVFPILWGAGRNGKGTLLETLQHILGPLAGPIKAEMLLEQGRIRASNAPDSDIMTLRGLRIAWASETNEGRRLNEGKIKWLTGSDTLIGRPPYGRREVRFRPVHKLFLLTNHRPKADPNDYALWQRLHLIPFTLSFVDKPRKENEHKKDPALKEKLRAEASGILAWLVRGCLTWQKEGLKPPEIIRETTAKYRKEEDVIGHFLDECCVLHPNARAQAGKLYAAYRTWCEENAHKPLSGTRFGEQIKEQFKWEKSGSIFYFGVGLAEK